MCGFVGIVSEREGRIRNQIAEALLSLQHRGTSSTGMYIPGLPLRRRMGIVSEAYPGFYTDDRFPREHRYSGLGHVRYPTRGRNNLNDTQPHLAGEVGYGSNGDLRNCEAIRQRLHSVSQNDARLSLETIMDNRRHGDDWLQAIERLSDDQQLIGAYSGVMLTEDGLWAFCDPLGIRPIALARFPEQGWMVASETCAFDQVGAKFEREIKPGEILFISRNGDAEVQRPGNPDLWTPCDFEKVYFSWPTSLFRGVEHAHTRRQLGRYLARRDVPDADMVVSVPNSANHIAGGYADESGLPYRNAFVRRGVIGRTFTQPKDRGRKVRLKFTVSRSIVKGKRVIVVDDSIVRCTTMNVLVGMLYEAGATEVHVRIGSPMVVKSCYYGIDTPTSEELVANELHGNVEAICERIGAYSLGFIDYDDFVEVMGPGRHCRACFGEEYPV